MSESGRAAAVAGRTYPPVTFEIDAERAAEFARSIGADPAAGVPPTFAAVYSLGVTAPQLFGDADAAVDFSRLLHAEQEFRWTRHPQPGETVISQGHVASDISRRGMRFVTFETETTDRAGEPVCQSKALFVIRSPQGPPPTQGEASELVG
ncbi:MAG TPA: MaoC family dehydratase N-terminal domain-containing protein [Candidatus Nitrosotalea sp.]|nr:MaoC family dehydratase N-terminal domain-containing protein [Candidatus Nitrosotalea sp.]